MAGSSAHYLRLIQAILCAAILSTASAAGYGEHANEAAATCKRLRSNFEALPAETFFCKPTKSGIEITAYGIKSRQTAASIGIFAISIASRDFQLTEVSVSIRRSTKQEELQSSPFAKFTEIYTIRSNG